MGSIAGFTFLQMDGSAPAEVKNGCEIIDRPFVDYSGFRLAAKKGEVTLRTTYMACANQTIAFAAEANYKTLIGSKVIVVEDVGKQYDFVLVKSVSQVHISRVVQSAPAGAAYIVSAVWELLILGA